MTAKTLGASPKLWAAIITAAVTYILGQQILELPSAAVVTGQVVLIALAVYRASPGLVEPENPFVPDDTPSIDHAVEDA